MTELILWAYTNKEISELKPEFERIFNEELTRDYENVWEWIWNGQTADNQINISREHNMNTGDYAKPLRIRLKWNTNNIDKNKVITDIQSIVRTKLYIGQILDSGRKENDYLTNEIRG